MIIKSHYNGMASPNKPKKRKAFQDSRVRWVLGFFVLAFTSLVVRAVYLQTKEQDFLQSQANMRFVRSMPVPANRGMITDRNGTVVAISVVTKSVFATPSSMDNISDAQSQELAKLLGVPAASVKEKLAQKTRAFVYLKRQLPAEDAKKVRELGIKGIGFEPELKRHYPMNEVFAHVVGFTGIDGNGQEGLELARDRVLTGQDGVRTVLRDNHGNVIDNLNDTNSKLPIHGQNITLALDQRIQLLAQTELAEAVKRTQAKAASVVVLDAQTGEVLALANVPTFNPNEPGKFSIDSRRNRAVVDMFEPGSAMKPISVAKALDAGKVRPTTVLNTNPYTIGSGHVKDTHVYPSLTVSGVIQKSSNVGSSKLSAMFSAKEMYDYYQSVGIGQSMHSGFPGESAGRLRNWKNWQPFEQATMSFGYGLQMNLLQLARAYTIFTADGQLLPVSFVKQDGKPQGVQIISPQTAKALRMMMQTVTEDGGTAKRAQVAGYDVAGKSGTARKLVNGHYSTDKYTGTFIGFAPAQNPKVIVAVMIDEPKGSYYGGTVAGPVFSTIAAESLRIMGVESERQVRPGILREANSRSQTRG